MANAMDALRVTLRVLRKNPGSALLAVLALGLGIGVTTLMFSFVYTALYRGLPLPASDRIMHLGRTNPSAGIQRMGVTIHDYAEWREQQHLFEDLAAYRVGSVNLSGGLHPERFDGAFVTANTFSVLRIQPVMGRVFTEDEGRSGASHVTLLSHHVWRDRYGGDPSVLGRVIRVNGEASTIIGVMPEGFGFPDIQDVWVPLHLSPLDVERGEGPSLHVVGRMRDGVTPKEVRAEFAEIARRLEEAYPETNRGVHVLVESFIDAFTGGGSTEGIFLLMTCTVFFILLVAGTNVANLLLARAAGRTKELAVRAAMGAKRLHLFGHLLSEAAVLAAGGSVLGIGVAWIGLQALDRLSGMAEAERPFWFSFEIDGSILLFVLGAGLVATLLSGALPALRASRPDVGEVLKDEARGATSLKIGRLSRLLVVTELAFSVALLISTGLMVKAMVRLRTHDYGFRTENIFTARLTPSEADFPDGESRRAFFRNLEDRLATLPGVTSLALTSELPGRAAHSVRFGIRGVPYSSEGEYPRAYQAVVSPSFFETFGVEVRSGRGFAPADASASEPVTIINQSFADRFFAGEDPIGRQIRQGRSESGEPWRTVVGVVPDMHMEGLGDLDADPAGFYVPLAQGDLRTATVAIASGGAPMSLTPSVRRAITDLHPDTPLFSVRPHGTAIRENLWFVDLFGSMFAAFGVIALLLAVAGLYGVMASSVARRTHELGIRMALGAEAREILHETLRDGLLQILWGLSGGLALALAISRGLRALFVLVQPWDPSVYLTVGAVLVLTGLIASLVPGLRATRVDPIQALRYE